MKTTRISKKCRACLLAVILALPVLHSAPAPALPLARPARELAEWTVRQAGKLTGRHAVERAATPAAREFVERAAREGGEELAEFAAKTVARHGDDALRALKHAPASTLNALRALPEKELAHALRALRRDPGLLDGVAGRHAGAALRAEAKAPGVGARLVRDLGDEGAALTQRLGPDEIVRLSAYRREVMQLPAADRGALLAALQREPGRIIGALERQGARRTLIAVTAIGTGAYVATNNRAGTRTVLPDGSTVDEGVVSVFINRLTERLFAPVGMAIAILTGTLALLAFAPGFWALGRAAAGRFRGREPDCRAAALPAGPGRADDAIACTAHGLEDAAREEQRTAAR